MYAVIERKVLRFATVLELTQVHEGSKNFCCGYVEPDVGLYRKGESAPDITRRAISATVYITTDVFQVFE